MYEYQSQDVTALAKALLAVQKSLQPALKDGENPFTKSHYATLNSVMVACRDALQSNGVWMTQLPMPTPEHLGAGHLALQTKLTHVTSGQWQSSLTIVPLPKNDPQGMGSAITYARRYALTAMLGMVTEDDDGEASKISSKRGASSRQPRNTPLTQNTSQHNVQHGNNTPQALNQASQQDYFSHIPRIDGITYQEGTSKDGRIYIVATGNTQAKKELLKGAGFQWNSQQRIWWKYADAI